MLVHSDWPPSGPSPSTPPLTPPLHANMRGDETEVLFGWPTTLPHTQMRTGGWASCLHQLKLSCIQTPKPTQATQHAISTAHHLHPSYFQNVRWRGIQGWFVRWISNVEWLGYYRYVNFMFYFFIFTYPPTPKYTPNEQEGTPSPMQPPITVSKQVETSLPPTPTPTPSALQLSARGLHHPLPLPLAKWAWRILTAHICYALNQGGRS